MFSKPQRAFFKEHAPEGFSLDDLTPLGPITILKLKFQSKDFDQPMVAELWFYPDGSRILELSTKCQPANAFQVAAATRAHLIDKGVNLAGEQQTKTRTALEFFAGQGADVRQLIVEFVTCGAPSPRKKIPGYPAVSKP